MSLGTLCLFVNALFVLEGWMKMDNNYFYDCYEDEDEDYEATDYLYRPKKQNSRKSLAPVFVYLILLNHSSPRNHLKQSTILDMLASYPYEVNIERKALGRIIHGLADSGLGIYSSKKDGCWFDEYSESCWAA